MIMVSRYSRFAYLDPLSPPGVVPAARAETMVSGEVEVDFGATEGQMNLEVQVYCLYDGQTGQLGLAM